MVLCACPHDGSGSSLVIVWTCLAFISINSYLSLSVAPTIINISIIMLKIHTDQCALTNTTKLKRKRVLSQQSETIQF